jgi:hypothetical protein
MYNELLNDPEFQKLIKEYLDYLDTSYQEILSTHLPNQNFTVIRKFGHNLKGTGSGYGFPQFTDVGKAIEFAARDELLEEVKKHLTEFEGLFREIQEKLQGNG